MTAHQPDWPRGVCSSCGQVWPCEPLVDELVAEHGLGLPLSAALWGLFDQAAHAVPLMPVLALLEQCIRRPLKYATRRSEANQ